MAPSGLLLTSASEKEQSPQILLFQIKVDWDEKKNNRNIIMGDRFFHLIKDQPLKLLSNNML